MNYIVAQKTAKELIELISLNMSIASNTGDIDQIKNAASVARTLLVYLNDLVYIAEKEAENDH